MLVVQIDNIGLVSVSICMFIDGMKWDVSVCIGLCRSEESYNEVI